MQKSKSTQNNRITCDMAVFNLELLRKSAAKAHLKSIIREFVDKCTIPGDHEHNDVIQLTAWYLEDHLVS